MFLRVALTRPTRTLFPVICLAATGCFPQPPAPLLPRTAAPVVPSHAEPPSAVTRLLRNAAQQTQTTRFYDPSYEVLAYPGGDVAPEKGVCSDVIIRAFRAAGIDLQQKVHEDMKRNWTAYPHLWGLKRPDPNIDHRRVANLMTFFARQKKSLPISQRPGDYLPGDVVAWRLPGGRLHIGLVCAESAAPPGVKPLVVHNIGEGARQEDVLFGWPIIGHYRYFGEKKRSDTGRSQR